VISNINLQKISNKFYVGIVRIDFKKILIRSTFFLQICDLKILAIFLLFTFFFEFAQCIPFFSQQELSSSKNLKPRKHVGWGGGFNLNI
jgi:hypothetical protein